MKKDVLAEFYERALAERGKHDLSPLDFVIAKKDHSDKWSPYKFVCLKKTDIGPVILAEGIVPELEKVSIAHSQYSGTPWWYEASISKSIIKELMKLPDAYEAVLPEPEMELEEIHAAQALVNRA